ncbi:MAG: ComF family protein [Leucobacter sp.]
MRSRSRWRELRLDLLALLWPTACVACGAADRDICDSCLAEAAEAEPPRHLDLGTPCAVRGAYDGPLREMLVAFKHGGRTGFARRLGPQLRVPLLAALENCRGPEAPVLVTVPSRRSRVRQRGYQHVDVLVTSALRGRRARVLRLSALRALRGRRGQVGLGQVERDRNARLIAVRRPARSVLPGREVILVDDIITTGATVLAARDELERAGARVVAIVALCAVERRDTRASEDEVARASGSGVGFWKGVTVRHSGPPA